MDDKEKIGLTHFIHLSILQEKETFSKGFFFHNFYKDCFGEL